MRILPYCGQYRVQIITDDGTDIEDILPKETDIAGSGVMFIDPGLLKLIPVNTRHETYDYEGIKIHNLSDWLLKIK